MLRVTQANIAHVPYMKCRNCLYCSLASYGKLVTSAVYRQRLLRDFSCLSNKFPECLKARPAVTRWQWTPFGRAGVWRSGVRLGLSVTVYLIHCLTLAPAIRSGLNVQGWLSFLYKKICYQLHPTLVDGPVRIHEGMRKICFGYNACTLFTCFFHHLP